MAVFQQMLIFFLLILAGLYARREGMITDANQAQISQLVLRIAYPAIILSGALTDEPHVPASELLVTGGIIAALLALLMLSAWLLPRLLGFKKAYYGIVNAMTMFSNIGFMGVPMIAAIYGSGALIYMTIFLIPFNLLFFSYGIQLVKGGKTSGLTLHDLLNEGMISCILALVIYLIDVPVPYVIRGAVQLLGNMTAPLAMLLIGAFLADMDWKGMFTDIKVWLFTLMKMVVIPVAIVWVLHFLTDNAVLLAVCMAAIATPAGNVLALLASVYNKEAYPISMKGIALTTLVSVVTMPAAFYLAGLN
jgi:predicted permease